MAHKLARLQIGILALLLCSFLGLPPLAHAQENGNEVFNDIAAEADQSKLRKRQIQSFHTDLQITSKGELAITETIRFNVREGDLGSGIARKLTTETESSEWGEVFHLKVGVLSVQLDGESTPYDLVAIDDYFEQALDLRVHSNEKELQPGPHTYTIKYRVDWAIHFNDARDSLVWSLEQGGVEGEINQRSITVTLPEGARFSQHSAHHSWSRSEAEEFRSGIDVSGRFVLSSTPGVPWEEVLKIELSWPSGHIVPPTFTEKLQHFIETQIAYFVACAAMALILLYAVLAFFIFRNRPPRNRLSSSSMAGSVPLDFSPATMTHLINKGEQARSPSNSSFVATLLDIAVKGHIEIHNDSEACLLKRTDKPQASRQKLTPDETALMDALFKDQPEFSMTEDNAAIVTDAWKAMDQANSSSLAEKYFKNNLKAAVAPLILGLIAWGVTIWHAEDFLIALVGFVFAFVPSLVIGYLLVATFASVLLSFRPGGCATFMVAAVGSSLCFGVIWFSLTSVEESDVYIPAWICVGCTAVAGLLFGTFSKTYTREGAKIKQQVDNYRTYLDDASKGKNQLGRSLLVTQDEFEKQLPFALVLGIHREWIDGFIKNTGNNSPQEQQHPQWYQAWNKERFYEEGIAAGICDKLVGMTSPKE